MNKHLVALLGSAALILGSGCSGIQNCYVFGNSLDSNLTQEERTTKEENLRESIEKSAKDDYKFKSAQENNEHPRTYSIFSIEF